MNINIVKFMAVMPVIFCLIFIWFFITKAKLRNICLIATIVLFLVCAGISVAFDSHAVIAETNEILDAKKTAYDCLEYGDSFPVMYDTIMVDDPVDERIESVKIRWRVFYRNVYIFYRYKGEM